MEMLAEILCGTAADVSPPPPPLRILQQLTQKIQVVLNARHISQPFVPPALSTQAGEKH